MPKNTTQQYIILPPRGLTADVVSPTTQKSTQFLLSLESVRTVGVAATAGLFAKTKAKLRVLDSIHENGAKLVEMSSDAVSDLRAEQPGVRIVPVIYHFPAIAHRPEPSVKPQAGGAALKIGITVVSRKDGKPIANAKVIAFTDFANRVGSQGTTNAKGVVSLAVGGASKKIQRLYIYSPMGFWNGLKLNFTLKSGLSFPLDPIDLSFTDSLRHFYGNSPDSAGRGVKVGVIDTGIAPHPDLVIEGGENTVQGENPQDFGDSGEGHGTHVAGIIAARGTPPTGIRGLAPGVTLRSYRVFGKGAEGASNFAIAKAIDRAVSDGCDLINMSLGGGPSDEATHSAMTHARASGVLIFAANGNDDRSPVSFPAADSVALAVSALGRKGTFPAGSTEVGDVASPFGTDKKDFIGAFSNVGPETDLTGPGVGIISTFPGGYAVLDGTSMACPAVTGATAKLLATLPAILNAPRDQARSDAMAGAVLQAAKSRGLGATFEGQGLL
ncbi:MAG TPA: S8 family serine peptidase [Candidatus Limnocylindria bacterium]|nr:S8 family serine peptidase [Candidatus Limnocylindria bacterium]